MTNEKIFEILKQNGTVFSNSWLERFFSRKGIDMNKWLEENLANGNVRIHRVSRHPYTGEVVTSYTINV